MNDHRSKYIADKYIPSRKESMAFHYIRDHQGNVRQVVDFSAGTVEQENHYYPGGMLFGESSATFFKKGTSTNPYRYGEKELLTADGLNLSLHGARMYEPALLRFITPDPLRHETPHLSSYLYCAANPVMLVDPSGLYGKRIINTKDKTVTIKALYYVIAGKDYQRYSGVVYETPSYNDRDIDGMNAYNEYLNGLGLTIPNGDYEGYSIRFDLRFERTESLGTATQDCTKIKVDKGINANVIHRLKEYWVKGEDQFVPYEEDGIQKTRGGVTSGKYYIVMNVKFDDCMLLLHEIFHTLGLDDLASPYNSEGIMAYPPLTPNADNMIELMNNETLEEEIQ